jgi:hypothetical protein
MCPGLFLFVLVPMAINIMATPMLVLMLCWRTLKIPIG